ncbi:MAG: thioredoxin-disulfide reductase [Desulfobacteraceae bacterium]|nr:thioredoxin-disulfide reductase [Desulfobacteraceae bacterium]
MASHIHDLIIIGGGPGGLTAGIYAQRAALDTLLIEKGAPGGQVNNSDEVENWPGMVKINGAELALNLARHAQSYGLEPMAREVVCVQPGIEFHEVCLDEGPPLRTHAVILATGGSPRKLGIPGEEEYYGKGVSYCAVCDGFFFRNKKVVVVGGGDSAAEEALYLAKITERVQIVHRRDELRAGRILQQRLAREPKIEIVWSSVLTSINANSAGVNGIDVRNLETGVKSKIPVDGVFIFVGFNPNNKLVPAGTKMSVKGYVITDEKCVTSIPGIYAVGDLREKYARQIVTAAADGCVAALAAAHYVEAKKTSL